MKVALHNLGCKVNAYETEVMSQEFEKQGYEIVDFSESADVYIINTCTVTNIADRKSRQMIHRSKNKNPNAIVVAVGCYAQVAADVLEEDDCADIIIGNNKKSEIVSLVEDYIRKQNKQEDRVFVEDICKNSVYEDMSLSTVKEHTRAYIKVQDGCNMFCSYCIIPYARGNVRSRDPENVITEIKELVRNGFLEVVITGIHLSSYIYDGVRLIDLIEKINDIEGLERIRLGSFEPGIVTEEFAKRLSACKKVCPHFHLSMQSGCDETLKRMNRKYDTALYFERCETLRKYYDNPALTTDVIVGFPGETEEEFGITKKFVEKVGFAQIHVFKYSKRNGTVAADMKDQIPENIKSIRSDIMIDTGDRLRCNYIENYLNKECPVLFEESINLQEEIFQVGFTPEYIKVAVKGNDDYSGKIKNVCMKSRSDLKFADSEGMIK